MTCLKTLTFPVTLTLSVTFPSLLRAGLLLLLLAAGTLLTIFLLALLFTLWASLMVDPGKKYTEDSPFYRALLNTWTAFVLWFLRVKVDVSGLDRLPPDGRFLLVCNHISAFDPIVTWHVLKKRGISFISKDENFHVPVFGRIIHRCLFLSIDRQDPKNAIAAIYQAADLLSSDTVSLGIFPEGTRNDPARSGAALLPFHSGVFRIARKAGVPIVVMTVRGTRDIQRRFPFRRSVVPLRILDTLSRETVMSTGNRELGEVIRREMEESIRLNDKNNKS